MVSRGRIMYYLLALCTAIILPASIIDNASGSFFKNGYFPEPYCYSIDTFPWLTSIDLPGMVVTGRNEGEYIVTSRGQSINVSLMETDPYQNWMIIEAKGAQCVGNGLIDIYPVRHVFRLKTNQSSVVRFGLKDERNGKIMETFEFNLVVDEPLSGIGWPAFSGDLVPSFVWPLQNKF